MLSMRKRTTQFGIVKVYIYILHFLIIVSDSQIGLEVACFYGLAFPKKPGDSRMAGKSWFTNFMRRHQSLSIRKPQATSLHRNSNFNRINVDSFFKKLASVYTRHFLQAKDVWNMDETGLVTVQKPGFMVASKGVRRVGAVTSGERGTLVTMALAGNALGNIIPPHFVFPRKRFLPHFIAGGPEGSIGTANGSGWMQEDDFLEFLKHFINHTRPTEEKKVLLLLNNHSSHISMKAIDLCRASGVVMLSFPPHCTHHLQPLDKAVYGPLKRYLNGEMDRWHRQNPGKSITIYDLPSLLNNILLRGASPQNVQAGFSSTGIWPYNPYMSLRKLTLPLL